MSDALLQKLKLQKTPVKQKAVKIILRDEDEDKVASDDGAAAPGTVSRGPVVIDKRSMKLVDRAEILKKIRPKMLRKPIVSIPVRPKESRDDSPGGVEESKEAEPVQPSEPVKKVIKKLPGIKVKKRSTKSRVTKKVDKRLVAPLTSNIMYDGKPLKEIIPSPFTYSIEPSPYFLNNRKRFTNFIQSRLSGYIDLLREEAEGASCERDPSQKDKPFTPFSHQKIVRDYLNLVTPYRGLLVYHGLGSGKTCTSITIAEGMKQDKPILVMTPASLQANFRAELLKCGDPIFRKNQYWTKVSLDGVSQEEVTEYARLVNVPYEYLKRKKEVWFSNVKQPNSNYNTLSELDREGVDKQITKMIESKYQFINYNGLQKTKLDEITNGGKHNIFSNKVVIIDEAHNLVSRIVNKLKKKKAIASILYEQLMRAENCKIVLLTGTPIINYPNEIGILFNILRGYIYTINIPLTITSTKRINEDVIRKSLRSLKLLDYVEYRSSTKQLVVTRNPFGFVNIHEADGTYKGVELNEAGQVTNESLVHMILTQLKKDGILDDIVQMKKLVKISEPPFKALPDDRDEFISMFINTSDGSFKDENKFKRRILGLTSHFKSAQEELMPNIKGVYVEKIPMSGYQFNIYNQIRASERKQESKQKKQKQQMIDGEILDETPSTYKIYSRAACNFVFPEEIPRPKRKEDGPAAGAAASGAGEDVVGAEEELDVMDEDDMDGVTASEKLDNIDGRYDADDQEDVLSSVERKGNKAYFTRIQETLAKMDENAETYLDVSKPEALQRLSPKFVKMFDNINDEDHTGLHMVYSQFRTLEGIGLFSLVLKANGYAQFKLKRKIVEGKEDFVLDISEEDKMKPKFGLYTGTESVEEKELVRKIYNNDLTNLNPELMGQLKDLGSNNINGDIIKVFMITAAGAEGINLKNTRYVHIMEPYWHPVRVEQVIGRARRICSHQEIEDPEKRTVEVFTYLMEITEEQLKEEGSIDLKLKDVSKRDKVTVFTTDQTLDEIADIKRELNKQILQNVRESAMDCNIFKTLNPDDDINCFTFGEASPDSFSSKPNYKEEEGDAIMGVNQKKSKVTFSKIQLDGKSYAYVKATNSVYDFTSVIQSKKDPTRKPLYLGKLVKINKKFTIKQD